MKTALELIILLPLLGALLNMLFGCYLPRRFSEAIACSVIWGSFAAAATALSCYTTPLKVILCGWLSVFDFSAPITLYLDSLSLSLCLMITFVCGLIHIYSVAYMAGEPDFIRFFALLNLFVAAMLLLILAENLPLLYLGWEGVGFCSYALIGFWYKEEQNATAGRKAFIVTRVGDVALGIAILWLFQLFSTVSITEINLLGNLLPVGVVTAIGLLLLIGASGKSAQLPLMVWLPDAMAGPTPVSAQIHAATMVTAGVYLLMRLFPFISLSGVALAAIAITGGATAFYGATCATAQRDLKRILAYSTISQIGFMVMGAGVGAINAATFHLIVHAFFKALLFLGAGCVITAMGHEQNVFRMGGLRRMAPGTYWPFLAGALCLAGFPFTGGFFSKESILTALWSQGGMLYTSLYLVGLLSALLTAFYTFRMVLLVFEGDGVNPHKVPVTMERMLLPLAILGLGGVLLNLPPLIGSGILDSFLAPLLQHQSHHLTHLEELLLSLSAALISLAGIGAAYLRYNPAKRGLRALESERDPSRLTLFLLHGWYFDALYRRLFVTPFVKLSRLLWERVDEGLIDDSLDRFATLLGRSGKVLSAWNSGRVSSYLLSFAAGLAVVVGWLVFTAMGQ